ncbi:aspartic proteinase CDR1-like [Telopea speciosissima]|uniref:aspartic proteinase CDR1-like n=1 Tax=Telopea speciosissima TaxID=54955 RepID=UPI001CC33C5D|nr:aspartic proteinase CDR1-like [Telopea speciosissima]
MAFMETLLSLISLLSSALLLHAAVEGPKAITLRLIHPFSPHSPFYPGNITNMEKIDLLIQGTEARMDHLFSTKREENWNGSSEVDDIVAPMKYTGFYYVAQVGIGSFPPLPGPKVIPYFFMMDTGSELTWVQCEGCDPCFPLQQQNFPYKRSQSYKPIPCGDPTCPTPKQDCFQSFCGFRISYGESPSPSAVGEIIRETLTFPSDFRGTESYSTLFLGCGFQSRNFRFPQQNQIGGILGLGFGGPRTFPLWNQVGKKRFSYFLCTSEHTNSKLYIGEGAKMVGPQVLSTPLLRGSKPTLYYVDLQDISIQNVRLGLQGSFSSGTAIDTGCPISLLVSNAYARVRIGFVQYFTQFHIQPYDNGSKPKDVPILDLCFPNPSGFNRYPTMTFHFKGADLVVQPPGIFMVGRNYICVALKSGPATMIGVFQQTNYKFSYDFELGDRRRGEVGALLFAPQDCGSPS